MARRKNGSRRLPVAAARSAPIEVPVEADPNHHLWRNGRLWWIAFTVHRGHQQERVRFSLGTPDVEKARRQRDAIFELFAAAEECQISLRFTPRRVAGRRAPRDVPRDERRLGNRSWSLWREADDCRGEPDPGSSITRSRGERR